MRKLFIGVIFLLLLTATVFAGKCCVSGSCCTGYPCAVSGYTSTTSAFDGCFPTAKWVQNGQYTYSFNQNNAASLRLTAHAFSTPSNGYKIANDYVVARIQKPNGDWENLCNAVSCIGGNVGQGINSTNPFNHTTLLNGTPTVFSWANSASSGSSAYIDYSLPQNGDYKLRVFILGTASGNDADLTLTLGAASHNFFARSMDADWTENAYYLAINAACSDQDKWHGNTGYEWCLDVDALSEFDYMEYTWCKRGTEVCDGYDNDCDGSIDEGCPGGYLDSASCENGAAGWARDSRNADGSIIANNSPDTSNTLDVHFYRSSGATYNPLDLNYIGQITANTPSGDVNAHRFFSPIIIPNATAGQQYTISAWGINKGTLSSGNPLLTQTKTLTINQETCDGLDNDCDGLIDENACSCYKKDSPNGNIYSLDKTLGLNASGLVAYWKMDDSTNGTTKNEKSGISVLGGSTIGDLQEPTLLDTNCIFGKCFKFNANQQDYISGGAFSNFNSSSFSISVWMKNYVQRIYLSQYTAGFVAGTFNFAPDTGGTDCAKGYGLYSFNSPDVGGLRIDPNQCGDDDVWTGTFAPGYSYDKWYNVVVTYDSTLKQGKIYVDGNLINTKNYSSTWGIADLTNFTIGSIISSAYGNVFDFNGVLDEVSYWNRVLTTCEAKQIALGPTACQANCSVPETCNGIDDDLDGLVDENICSCYKTASPNGNIYSLQETLGTGFSGLGVYIPFDNNKNDIKGNVTPSGTYVPVLGKTFFHNAQNVNKTAANAIKLGQYFYNLRSNDSTYSIWVKPRIDVNSSFTSESRIWGWNNRWEIYFCNGGYLCADLGDTPNHTLVSSRNNWSKYLWYNIIITWDSLTAGGYEQKMWINGVLEDTAITLGASSSSDKEFYIGSSGRTDISNPFDGNIDDFSYFTKVLTDCEIKQIALGPAACQVNCGGSETCNGVDDDLDELIDENACSCYKTDAPNGNIYSLSKIFSVSDPNLYTYWPLDGNLVDKAGNMSTLVSSSTEKYSSGVNSNFSSAFDVNRQNYLIFNGGGSSHEKSISFWFKPKYTRLSSDSEKYLFGQSTVKINSCYWADKSLKLKCDFWHGPLYLESTTTNWQADKWYHLVITSSASQRELWINGIRESVNTGNAITSPSVFSPLNIASFQGDGNEFIGAIDDFAIFEKVLTDCEIKQIALGPAACKSSCYITETCNGIDDDLDGLVDENACTCYDATNDPQFPAKAVIGLNATGLVSYWPFDSNAGDYKSTNHGTAKGVIALVASKFGNGYSFDGLDDYITIANNSSLNFGAGNFSYCFWFKQPSYVAGKQYELVGKRSVPNGDYEIQINTSEGTWGVLRSYLYATTGEMFSFPYARQASTDWSTWTHVCYVRDNNEKIYVNGVIKATQTGTGNTINVNSDSNLEFGRDPATPATPELFNGSMDDVVIFNRGLTACEVKQLYGGPNACLPVCPAFSCTGSVDTNSIPFLDDNVGLTHYDLNTIILVDPDKNTSRKCEYYCRTGYYRSGSVCLPQSGLVCGRTLDPNSTICTGTDTGLTLPTDWNVVGTSVVNCTGANKCSSYCNPNYVLQGGTCVLSPLYNNCTGTRPAFVHGMIRGTGIYLVASPPVPTDWSYQVDANVDTPCRWTCANGYAKQGNTCVVDLGDGIIDFNAFYDGNVNVFSSCVKDVLGLAKYDFALSTGTYSNRISDGNCLYDGTWAIITDPSLLVPGSILQLSLLIPGGCDSCSKTIYLEIPKEENKAMIDDYSIITVILLLVTITFILRKRK